MNKVLVSPSVLSADFLKLGDEIDAVLAAGGDMLHVDVMDGHYVPNLSFGMPIVRAVCKRSTVPVDVHFMVTNGADYIDACAEAGVHMVTLHVEACTHLHSALSRIRKLGMKAGVALNPATGPEFLRYLPGMVDFVLVMSVNPGFSGQKFIVSTPDKIRVVRQIVGDPVRIGVDGGVTEENAPSCIAAGADTIMAATAVFGQTDYALAIRKLRGLA